MCIRDSFNQVMTQVTLPAGLQSLTFGEDFNHDMTQVTLPAGLQNLTFGHDFNQDMTHVTLPAGLQSLTFAPIFWQRTMTTFYKKVTLPKIKNSIRCFQDRVACMSLGISNE